MTERKLVKNYARKVKAFFKDVWAETTAQTAKQDDQVEQIVKNMYEGAYELGQAIRETIAQVGRFCVRLVSKLFNLSWKLAIIFIAAMLFKMNFPTEYDMVMATVSDAVVKYISFLVEGWLAAVSNINSIF